MGWGVDRHRSRCSSLTVTSFLAEPSMASSLLFSSISTLFCFTRDCPMRAAVFRSLSFCRETSTHREYFRSLGALPEMGVAREYPEISRKATRRNPPISQFSRYCET